jgi:leucine dehydrogenase
MTLKAAAAGLELGGGKSALCVERGLTIRSRRDLMRDLGDVVDSLEGRYVVAEDVGTGAEDMAIVAERTPHVVGLPVGAGGSGDPSPVTARGVEAAMRTACEHAFGSASLDGVRVCVIGLGHVGASLAERLASAGARLIASDLDPRKRSFAEELGGIWVDPDHAATIDCEVLAPCALGGAIDAHNVDRLSCRVVCGSANNTLADEGLAERLHERGILYAPDFIANAGGLINVFGELRDLPASRVEELVEGIGPALDAVLEESSERDITPLAAARRVAAARLDRAREPAPAKMSA